MTGEKLNMNINKHVHRTILEVEKDTLLFAEFDAGNDYTLTFRVNVPAGTILQAIGREGGTRNYILTDSVGKVRFYAEPEEVKTSDESYGSDAPEIDSLESLYSEDIEEFLEGLGARINPKEEIFPTPVEEDEKQHYLDIVKLLSNDLEYASRGEWFVDLSSEYIVNEAGLALFMNIDNDINNYDAEFVLNAKNFLPELLEYVKKLIEKS